MAWPGRPGVTSNDDVEAAIGAYVAEMTRRVAEIAKDSVVMEGMILWPTAAHDIAGLFGLT